MIIIAFFVSLSWSADFINGKVLKSYSKNMSNSSLDVPTHSQHLTHRSLENEWQVGYYYAEGAWQTCHYSWYTCENGYECTSWINKYFNSTTKLCEFWPDGKFFTESIKSCVSCEGSCSGDCAYQLLWFKWPDTQKFSLGKSLWSLTL